MANLIPNITKTYFDDNGEVLAGGKIYSYAAGTTTPLATYTDSTEGTENTNPVILDANGQADIWIGASAYKFVITDADDVEIKTVDNVAIISNGSVTTAKLADGSVTTPKIADLNVTTGKLADLGVTAAKLSADSVTTAKVLDSAITTAKLADESVSAAKLADDMYSTVFTERSKIINGDMEFAQRATLFSPAVNNSFTLDRWRYINTAASSFDVSQSVVVPTFAQLGYQALYSMGIFCNTADATIGAADLVEIGQPIEGSFFRDLVKKAFVFSFAIKSNKTGTLCVAFKNGITDNGIFPPTKSYVAQFTIDAVNTWEKKVIEVPAPTDGTWNGGPTTGLYAAIVLACGTDYQTTAGAWQNGDYSGTSAISNFSDSDTNEIFITGVRLEGGSIPRQYESRAPALESLLCRRYYENVSAYFAAYNPNVAASQALGGVIHIPIGKPTAPTPTVVTNTLQRVDTPIALVYGFGILVLANFITGSAGTAYADLTLKLESELTI